jgi:hypothetical protein
VDGVRKAVPIAAAVVLFVEAVGVALLNWIMGIFVDRQQMSMAGMDPDAMTVGTWALGALNALFLIAVGVVLLRAGLRERAPERIGRILVIVTAVVHGVVGALAIGLVGWGAFVGAMVVLGLLVLSLVLFEQDGNGGGGDGDDDEPTPVEPPKYEVGKVVAV